VAAGDLDELASDLSVRAEQWGRLNGCTMALIESREGWARKMKPYGYEPFQIAIAKDL
jgi:hypothetical protein